MKYGINLREEVVFDLKIVVELPEGTTEEKLTEDLDAIEEENKHWGLDIGTLEASLEERGYKIIECTEDDGDVIETEIDEIWQEE